ncbi:MAG: hypothetical protein ACPG77_20995 [Nannocystaceae bacterium]
MVHSLALDADGLRAAFPFYLAFSRDLQVVDVGPSLAKIAPALVPGEGLLAHLSVVQPELESLDFTALTQHPGAVFVLELGDSGTMLSGPILLASQPSVGLFLGSPSLAGVSLVDRESLSRGDDEHRDSERSSNDDGDGDGDGDGNGMAMDGRWGRDSRLVAI